MNLNSPKRDWLRVLQIIAVSILAIVIIYEQLYFLKIFYPKYIAHWIVTLVFLMATLWFGYQQFKATGWKYLLTEIFLLITLLFQLELLLKLHEYSHLTYLLGYFLTGITGLFCGAFYHKKRSIQVVASVAIVPFFLLIWFAVDSPFIAKSQRNYADRVIESDITDFHCVDITSWRGNQWFYYNDKVQFSTVDEWLYAEPMVHPVMKLLTNKQNMLVIGGENGILLKEILKYDEIQSVDLSLTDNKLFELALQNSHFNKINQNSLLNKKLNVLNSKLSEILNQNSGSYDAIFIDVPDPTKVHWNEYYTKEFYQACYKALSTGGILITQAGSPYFATKGFVSIEKTLQAASFQTLPIHNQVLTLGEWGWIIASKSMQAHEIKSQLLNNEKFQVPTRWLNMEAMQMLVSFGKPLIKSDSIEINTSDNPVLIDYYKNGNFGFR